MSRTERQHIRDWLKALAALAASTQPVTEFDAKITAYIPLLATDFPQAAFGPGSLAAIARQCKFFPSYAELCEHLSVWWREHRPPPSQHLLVDPKARSHKEWREMAEQSWRDISAAEVRAKIVATQRIDSVGQRMSLGRILAHAIATHAPQHLGLLPPDWIAA